MMMSSDVIRHTSQSQHPMRATVPPTSISLPSPHHMGSSGNREPRMTPTQAHAIGEYGQTEPDISN